MIRIPKAAWKEAQVVLVLSCGALILAVGALSAGQMTSGSAPNEMAEELAAGAGVDEIARYALAAQRTARVMASLPARLPNLDRRRAYEIQNALLKEREKTERRIGWKLAWSRAGDPAATLNPAFGHVMQSHLYQPGSAISAANFVGGGASFEAEVAIWVNRDLPGPQVTRDEVLAAISEIGPAIELVNRRLPTPHTREHAIVDNVYHAGVLLGAQRTRLSGVDFATEMGRAELNGELKAEGATRLIMARDPIEAVVWLANELPKYGQYLRANDFVLTGTVLSPPPVKAGDKAKIAFTTLGSVEFEMKP